jgi:hypothetical protein
MAVIINTLNGLDRVPAVLLKTLACTCWRLASRLA